MSATPSEAATPGAAHLHSAVGSSRNTPTVGSTKGGNKKKKAAKKEEDDANEDSERPTKRGKVSWNRD